MDELNDENNACRLETEHSIKRIRRMTPIRLENVPGSTVHQKTHHKIKNKSINSPCDAQTLFVHPDFVQVGGGGRNLSPSPKKDSIL